MAEFRNYIASHSTTAVVYYGYVTTTADESNDFETSGNEEDQPSSVLPQLVPTAIRVIRTLPEETISLQQKVKIPQI